MSEVAMALLQTANKLSAAGRRVTLAELAAGACVGQLAARQTVARLKRLGHLQIVGERRVSYRNRPVAEYAPTLPATPADEAPPPWLDLNACMSTWAR